MVTTVQHPPLLIPRSLAIATIWATVVHGPRMPAAVPRHAGSPLRAIAAAIASVGFPRIAATFGSVAVINAVVMLALDQ
jgi:hypothetical protein